MSRPGGASLDGEDPASACAAISRDPPKGRPESTLRGLCPARPRERHSTVLVGPRSMAPPRCTSRSRCFRPRTETATSPLTPSVTTLRGSGREAASPSLRVARPAFFRRLVKDSSFRRTRAPSIAECSLPRSRAALSLGTRGISRSPPPVSLLACSWLSPPRPGFRRAFTPELPRVEHVVPGG